ncbi:MAG: response regulator [Nitrospiraceae bacterium]|nr:MAG: response regulator [Nitrospiraceae bacterium]
MQKKILIVDDEINFLYGLSRALNKYCRYNGDIMTVNNGMKAMDAINSCAFDICFLDLNLPDISGFEIMRRINNISPKTKIAIMSGSFLTDEMKEQIKGGSSIFFSKPIELDQIKDFIEHIKEKDNGVNDHEEAGEMPDEKRSFQRRAFTETVRYSLGVFNDDTLKFNQFIDIVDISEGGLGVKADHFLKAGQILKFDYAIEKKMGIVKWSTKVHDHWRAGIKFL